MVRDEPGTAPIEPFTGSEMETTIMDFDLKAQNETDDTVTLVNNYYASTTWKTRLQPEDSAAYACRRIHMATSHYTLGEFVAIHDLLLDHKPNDRDKILSKLRRVPRRQEIKSSQRPSLRPVFVTLDDEDQTENLLGIPDLEEAKCDLPAFVSIPTIHFHTPYSQSVPENSYHVKSLLQYHSVVPGGWLLDGSFRKVEKHMLGLDFMELIRFASFMFVLSRSDENKTKTMNRIDDWVFSPLRTFLAFSPGRYDGEPLRNLSALDEHMNHWIDVERTTWDQAEASEEVAQALRNLWSIAIRFTMNFHLSPDRDIFQLDRLSLWRRIINYIRHDSNATSAKTELLYKPGLRAQSPETLQDLEDELTAAITNLDRHHGTAQSEPQASRDNENKNVLRSIQSFGDDLSLACLLPRVSLYPILEVSHYELEWLIRDSASHPQVYQTSAISDELRILKEILHSQMQVLSQVARSLAKVIASSVSTTVIKSEASESADTPGTRKDNLSHDEQTQIFEALQRKSQLRHRQLTYDVEKLQDAMERLKSRAALYIKIKAEDQNVAIYVFTLVTVFFLPLSFATSYMGMNTSDIRDMEQG
ncbi:mg2+ transporter zinc transport [Fusarium globosum]|uniref:Mg2+ transporter zinc transport n=1 Tax=Fusarium globosum TaxID=78864 RepID=A0A8H6CXK8_9HYPO|nr:mg2+ transporter zinc transport [Fusarium globosum]